MLVSVTTPPSPGLAKRQPDPSLPHSIIALTATYPLMTANTLQAMRVHKTQQQQQQQQQADAAGEDGEGGAEQRPAPAAPVLSTAPPRGVLAEIAALMRQGGWPALYAGLKPSLIGTTVSQGEC